MTSTSKPVPKARRPDVDDRPAEPIDPAHRAAVEEGLADLRAGRLATDEEIEEAFRRFGRAPR